MHGGCDSSTGDVYSSFAPDPTTDTSRDPCFPNSIFCVADRSYEVDHCSLLLAGNTQNAECPPKHNICIHALDRWYNSNWSTKVYDASLGSFREVTALKQPI